MSIEKKLQLKFDPNTIDDLGAKLYSTLPPILSELIANGFDAGASKIYLEFHDEDPSNKIIIVKDNGVGMSFDEVNNNYLIVGRKKREDADQRKDPVFKRLVMGKKGIGKLSFFGITDHAEITTIHDNEKITFEMDRKAIKAVKDYFPNYIVEHTTEENGTVVKLNHVKREADFDIQGIIKSISNYFLFDKDFRVFVKYNSEEYEEITNDTRYQQLDVQFTWDFPTSDYPFPQNIRGKIFTAKKPLTKKLKGITLLSRKKLVNLPQLFPVDSSDYFFEYLTGYLEIDFIDELPEDVISTDRKALNWGDPALAPLREWLEATMKKIQKDWRVKWKAAKTEKIRSNPGIKEKVKTIRSDEERVEFENAVDSLAEADIDPESAVEVMDRTLKEYPDFHNKHLDPELAEVTFDDYKEKKYYDAVIEGVKRYMTKVRTKANYQGPSERTAIQYAFGESLGRLSITKKYEGYKNAQTGAMLTDETKENLSNGNRMLAEAMMTAFRNPIVHQEHEDLTQSEIYTDKDCLDALSLLSHLYRRINNAEEK